MYVLGIETSCDETAVAILDYPFENIDSDASSNLYKKHNIHSKTTHSPSKPTKILANIIYSQIKEHQLFGGVVPEIAARNHTLLLDKLILQALEEAQLSKNQLDLIAVTQGPGLVGGLIVGLMSAKALSLGLNIPFIGINHLEGHALTAKLTNGIEFPYLLLLISGGHTQILIVESLNQYHRIGSTIDDALGEAFDKTAKLLNLPYPGGPSIEKMAQKGNPERFIFPRPLIHDKRLAFSFSGLKTAVHQKILKLKEQNQNHLREEDIFDLCASFQAAVTDSLREKLKKSFNIFKEKYPNIQYRFVVSGGVGANLEIRKMLEILCNEYNFKFFAPPINLCTDNAVMIAFAGAERFSQKEQSSLNLAPRSRWPLDKKASPLFGSGKRGAKA